MFTKSRTESGSESMPAPIAARTGGATFSVIGADVVIDGNITATVDLHIDGKISGDIKCAALVQGEGSTVTGAIIAERAQIAGTVNGSVSAKELIVERSARITGDVHYEKISIAAGGKVDGKLSYSTPGVVNRRAEQANELKLVGDPGGQAAA